MPPPLQNNYVSFPSAMAPGDSLFRTVLCSGVLQNDTISLEVLPTVVPSNTQNISVNEIQVIDNGTAFTFKLTIAPGTAPGIYQLLISIFMASDATLVVNRNINLTIQNL